MSEGKSPIAELDTANDERSALVWDMLAAQHGNVASNRYYQQVSWLLRVDEVVSAALILKLYEDYTAH